MSIGDAIVEVTCNYCTAYDKEPERIQLTALAARNSYDMRYVARELQRRGWRLDGDLSDWTMCPLCALCVEEAEQDEQKKKEAVDE